MATVSSLLCCGWAELDGVQHYKSEQFHAFLATVLNYSKGAFVFCSATTAKKPRTSGALRFAKDLEKNKLGTVTILPLFVNPNTGHKILPFLWQVDWVMLRHYCKENNITVAAYRW